MLSSKAHRTDILHQPGLWMMECPRCVDLQHRWSDPLEVNPTESLPETIALPWGLLGLAAAVTLILAWRRR